MFAWWMWLGACQSNSMPKSEQPVIILVSIDTLRADHLGVYGYSRDTSPFMDGLASKGVRFAKARSASPWTLPAHATMLTGLLPSTHMITDDNVALSPETPILQEILQQRGWKTAGIVSTMYVSRLFGFDRGFDFFEDFGVLSEKQNLSGSINASNVVDTAWSWMKEQPADAPLFVFLHFYDVHYSYEAPSPYDTHFDRESKEGDVEYKNYMYFTKRKVAKAQQEHQIAQYDEEIYYVDRQLEKLSTQIAPFRSNVRWVITADHGEEFWERGSWGHAHTLYNEQLHIPLIVSGYDIPSAVLDQEWVGNHDIAPTILSWVQDASPDIPQMDGIALTPFFTKGDTLPQRSMLAETSRFKTNKISLLEGEYRLEWDLQNNKSELFDISVDSKEKYDISKNQPEILFALQRRAEDLLGKPWTVQQDGRISCQHAVVFQQGRKSCTTAMKPGDKFQVLPYDTPVFFQASGETEKKGPIQQIGGTTDVASDFGLILDTKMQNTGKNVLLDDAAKKRLEHLGYIQEE